MAIVYEEGLKKNVSSKKILPVYLLFGEDAYLKGLYLNKISRSIAEPDDVFNFCKFSGQCDLQAVYDAVMQMPFMSERKCVILNDYDFEHCSKSDFSKLTELISEVPEETTLIMYFDGIETDHKKGAKFKKIISAAEKCGGMAVLLNHRTRAELVKMLCDGALKRGCKMESQTANYLVETAGDDINLLSNELQKLCAFVQSGIITKNHVDEVCVKTVEANIYKLSEYILATKSTEALKIIDDLFFSKTEPMIILYTISGVFVDIYRVYCARQQGIKNDEVIEKFKYPSNKTFLVQKAAEQLKRFDSKKISLCLKTLTNADKDLKSFGKDPRTVIEELIVKLIYIIAKGESLD